MPNESRSLTAQRIRKERALASMRELQLAQLEGTLVPIATVEATWAAAIIRMRDAMLAVPMKVRQPVSRPAPRRSDHSHRSEIALKQLNV